MKSTKRLIKLREFMKENQITLNIISNPDNQYYISGFKAITYSRPIVLLVESDSTTLIIPGLEEEHAKAEADINQIMVYYEHPEKADKGKSHLEHLDTFLSKYPKGTKVGIEFFAAPVGLADYLKSSGFQLVDIGKKIIEMRYVKDEQEIELITKSGELVRIALSESIKHACSGISEMELDDFGNSALFEEVALNYSDSVVDIFVMSPSGVVRTNMPHVFSNTKKLKQNEVVIHSRQVGLNGYRTECERTLFVGKPNDKQKYAFDLIVEAQQAALDIIRPGITAKEVDFVARKIIRDGGFGDYAIHRVGHGIGLGMHEEPYLRFDNELILEEGMVFSVEPGIYIPELGGFRHSDTVVLTRDGARMVTDFPRTLEDLMF